MFKSSPSHSNYIILVFFFLLVHAPITKAFSGHSLNQTWLEARLQSEPSYELLQMPAKDFQKRLQKLVAQKQFLIVQQKYPYDNDTEIDGSVFIALNIAAATTWQEMLDCNDNNVNLARDSYGKKDWKCSDPQLSKKIPQDLQALHGLVLDWAAITMTVGYENSNRIGLIHPLLGEVISEEIFAEISDMDHFSNDASSDYLEMQKKLADFEQQISNKTISKLSLHSYAQLSAIVDSVTTSYFNYRAHQESSATYLRENFRNDPAYQKVARTLALIFALRMLSGSNCEQLGLWPTMTRDALLAYNVGLNDYISDTGSNLAMNQIHAWAQGACGPGTFKDHFDDGYVSYNLAVDLTHYFAGFATEKDIPH